MKARRKNWRDRQIYAPRGTKVARLRVIRADYAMLRVDVAESISRLTATFPSLTMSDDAWLRLLTDPEPCCPEFARTGSAHTEACCDIATDPRGD